jgi:protoporphyrinogen oxidase
MPQSESQSGRVVIIGGGPAGLTAAYQLSKSGVPLVVLEKDHVLGGLARTIKHDGYYFDIGGHRFYTKVTAVEELWHEIMPTGSFLKCSRLSRIYFKGKYFHYPLRFSNALKNLGFWNSILVLASYARARFPAKRPADTFEGWISSRFGKRLYETFFKTYTEKVWGIPCNQISSEWAAQRIRGLSLPAALRSAVLRTAVGGNRKVIRSLIDTFNYPERGPGMMWEAVGKKVLDAGGEIYLQAGVERIHWRSGAVQKVEVRRDGVSEFQDGTHFISSMPIGELIMKLEPAAPARVLQAAKALRHRDFLMVAVIVNRRQVFPDNWIYIHDPGVKVGRIQNFKNWSACMVPDPDKTCLGMEYFCFAGDNFWSMPDDSLVGLASKELESLGLVSAKEIDRGMVVRMPKAYPIYARDYACKVATIREFIELHLPNLQAVGRNGMHKYNNQDHSMYTAMLAVENILGAQHDLWRVNADPEYHEEVQRSQEPSLRARFDLASTQPRVPRHLIQTEHQFHHIDSADA